MKATPIITAAIGLACGYALCTVMPITSEDGCVTSSAPFIKIEQADAERYAHNYTPDPAIQPTTAFLLTSDIITSLKFINDSLGGAGVRVYFAATNVGNKYDGFVAIGIDDAHKDVPPTNGKNLFVNRIKGSTTIDVCPKMCDINSPLNH